MVGISGFVMVISTVPLFHAMSVWAVALEREFGWNRTQLGFALTFTRVEGGFMGPIEGYLTDKVGTRRMVFIGLLILGGAFIFFGQVQNLWMFYLAYVLMAVGQGLGSWIPLMTMLTRWFHRRRAMAIGWSNMGSRLGALILVPVIAYSIDPDHERLGWRMTATILGIVMIVVAGPVSKLIRNQPQDYGLLPDGDKPTPSGAPAAVAADTAGAAESRPTEIDFTTSEALRTPAFWLIAFGHGFTSMVILAIMAHLGLLMIDKGYQLQDAAFVVSVYTAVAMGFQLVGGYVGGRIPIRLALAVFTSLQAVGVIVLVFADSLSTFYLFAVVFGAGFGGRNPLTIAIRGDYFGSASFGKILGISTVPMNVLLLIAAPLVGYMRDVQGTYTDAFIIMVITNFAGAVCFALAKRPEKKPALQPTTAGEDAG
ncbi:MAG: MFS transporter [Chloroflexi bacterium]|nr:MFS transporter [Chloroflexota bacterium]MCI0863115.1 MFS transporter [Chloroflexota bacterium]